MSLSDFMGGIGAISGGYLDGKRKAAADRRQQELDAEDTQIRARNAQLRQEAIAGDSERIRRAQEIATDADNARTFQRGRAPGIQKGITDQDTLDRNQLGADLADQPEALKADRLSKRMQRSKSMADAKQIAALSMGEKLVKNDMAGFFEDVKDFTATGLSEAAEKYGVPASAAVGKAPEGSMDLNGQAISGPAIELTYPDGVKRWMNPVPMMEAYKDSLEAKDVAGAKDLSPGARRITPSGREIAYNSKDGKYETDDQGNVIRDSKGEPIPRKGKATDPDKAIDDAFELAATKGGMKIETPEAMALGKRLAVQIAANGVPPALAVEVALLVSQNPKLSVPSIHPVTGQLNTIYNHPTQGEIVIDKNAGAQLKPAEMKTLTQGMLDAQLPTVQPVLLKAAADPKIMKALEEATANNDPANADQNIGHLREKVKLIQKYLLAAKQDVPGKVITKPGGIWSPSKDAPAHLVAKAKQAIKSAAEAELKRKKKDASDKKSAAEEKDARWEKVKWLDPQLISAMSRSEARKYLQYRDILSPEVVKALNMSQ